LSAIAEPSTAEALVRALDDEDGGVRWLAAQGLVHIGPAALPPLLRALVRNSMSAWLREGSHHVIRMNASDELAPVLQPVLRAMHGVEPSIGVMAAAEHALGEVEARLAVSATAEVPAMRYAPRGPAVHTHGSWRHIALRP
jgi:HEAT repeat protein